MTEQELIRVVTRQRVKGGWGEFVPQHLPIAEVGQLIRRKMEIRQRGNLFHNTPIGENLMVSFSGTLSQIADCYQAAGEEVYVAYCEGTLDKLEGGNNGNNMA